jgi:membrane protein DedA with SNARE-associated domain
VLDASAVIGLLKGHGLSLLAPLAVIEGPIVTVLAGSLASAMEISLWTIAFAVIVGDLIGDALFYALGRAGPKIVPSCLPRRWRDRISAARLAGLAHHFEARGGRTLVLAKMTHSLGVIALLAAGAARMNLWSFLGWNLLATLPKSAALLGLGYWLGQMSARITHTQIELWLARGVWFGAGIGGAIVAVWVWKRRSRWAI